jgi:hypothetical protein
MSLDVGLALTNPLIVLTLTALLMLSKFVLVTGSALLPVPGAKTELLPGDEVLLSGCPGDIGIVASMFSKGGAPLPDENDTIPAGTACPVE